MKRIEAVKIGLLLLLLLLNTTAGGQILVPVVNRNAASTSPNTPRSLAKPAPAVDCCKESSVEGVTKTYTYDARGSQNTFDISHHKHDRIRILIRNKNPFLYDYTVTVKATVVSEPALAALADLFGGVVGDFASAGGAAKATETAKATASSQAARRMAVADCPTGNTQYEAVRTLKTNLSDEVGGPTTRSTVEGDLQNMKDRDERIRADYKAGKEKLENPQADCATLCSAANDLHDKLAAYSIADPDFEKRIDDVKRHAINLLEAASQLRSTYPQCSELVEWQAYARFIAEKAAPDYLNAFKAIVKNKKDLDDADKTIVLTLSSAESFNQSIVIGPFRAPTDVAIKVERKLKKADAKPETVIDATANFGGGQRFTLAGGLAITNLEKREFQRIQPATGDPVVGLKENSSMRVVPIVVLHCRLYDFRSFVDGFHFSVGVTAKNDNKGTDIEYLFGPSLSFAEERFFITGGAYAGKQQRLEGGFELGTPVPMGVSELPTRKEYHWKFGVSFTYKIK